MFDLNITELDKSFPIKYQWPEIHKTPKGARFIVASYYWSTNELSDKISKNFKMIFNNVLSFHNKSFFYSGCKKFWVAQNSFPIATKLNKINVKKKPKPISTFNFRTLCTTILHKLLLKVLSSIYWTSKCPGRRYFTKKIFVNVISSLIHKCFVTVLVTWF